MHLCTYTLLHFTSILSAKDNHFVALEVDRHGGGGGHTSSVAVGREFASVEDGKVGSAKVLQFFFGGADQHVAHEEQVVCTGGNNTDLLAVLGVPAGETIKDIEARTGIEVVDGTLAVDQKDLFVNGSVDRTPPDILLGGFFTDNTLVLGRTASLLARVGAESTGRGDHGALLVSKGFFVENGNGGVALDGDL